jgi:hypothetical protein
MIYPFGNARKSNQPRGPCGFPGGRVAHAQNINAPPDMVIGWRVVFLSHTLVAPPTAGAPTTTGCRHRHEQKAD